MSDGVQSMELPAQTGTRAVEIFVQKVLELGLDGVGPIKGAHQIAEEHRARYGDPEVAIQRLIRTHVRLVAGTGFATGFGGVLTLAVTAPTDVTVFYALAARCAAAVADLRGHDIHSEEVRSVVLLTLLGAEGAAIAAKFGAEIGNKAAMAALKKLPGTILIQINKKVGFRLMTKFGQKGVINLVRVVPLAGGGVGAGVNTVAMRGISHYAKINFPRTEPPSVELEGVPTEL